MPAPRPRRANGAGPPAAWAREVVSAVVEAGTFRLGGSAWRLLEGESVFHADTGWSGTGEFQDPRIYQEISSFRNPLTEGTGEALGALDQRLAELIAEGNRIAMQAVEEVRWFESTRKTPDASQRLMLHVRAFERELPITPTFRWADAVAHYLKHFWALEEFDGEIFFIAHRAHTELERNAPAALAGLEEWVTRENSQRFTVSMGAFLREAARIHEHLPSRGRLDKCLVKQVVGWAKDPAAARQRIREWEECFSRLLARAVRQRNATVHGVTTVPEVVDSVDAFVSRIAGLVVAEAVERAATSGDLVSALQSGRSNSLRKLWRLEQGGETSDAALYNLED